MHPYAVQWKRPSASRCPPLYAVILDELNRFTQGKVTSAKDRMGAQVQLAHYIYQWGGGAFNLVVCSTAGVERCIEDDAVSSARQVG